MWSQPESGVLWKQPKTDGPGCRLLSSKKQMLVILVWTQRMEELATAPVAMVACRYLRKLGLLLDDEQSIVLRRQALHPCWAEKSRAL